MHSNLTADPDLIQSNELFRRPVSTKIMLTDQEVVTLRRRANAYFFHLGTILAIIAFSGKQKRKAKFVNTVVT